MVALRRRRGTAAGGLRRRRAGAGRSPSCARLLRGAAARPTWCRRPSSSLAALPLTPNGKVDRRALPGAGAAAPGARRVRARRATPVRGAAGARSGPRCWAWSGWAPRRLLRPRRPLAAGDAAGLAGARELFGVRAAGARALRDAHRGGAGAARVEEPAASRRAARRRRRSAPRARGRSPCRSPSPRSASGSSTGSSRARRPTTSPPPCACGGRSTPPPWSAPSTRSSRRHEALRTTFAERRRRAGPDDRAPARPSAAAAVDLAAPARGRARGRGWRGLAGEEARRPFDLAARAAAARPSCVRLGRGRARARSSPSTTSSPTAGRWACCCASWRRSTGLRRRAALAAARAADPVRRLRRLAAAAGCAARRWQRSSPTGASGSAGAARRSSCRPTGRGPPRRASGAAPAALALGRRSWRGASRPSAAARGRHAVHGPAGRLPGPARRATPARTDLVVGTPVANREPRRGRGADRLLRQHPGAARRTSPATRLRRAAAPGPRDRARGLRPPGPAVRAAGRGAAARARPGRTPLFQVLLRAARTRPARAALGGLGLALQPAVDDAGTAKFDLTLSSGSEAGDGLAGSARVQRRPLRRRRPPSACCGHLAGPARGGRGRRRSARLRSCRCSPRPSAASSCASGTARRAAAPASAASTSCSRSRRRARRRPWRWSSRTGARSPTRELDARANRLARRLRRAGRRARGAGRRSASSARRRWWSALLGILKAGGAYVPLDPSYPAERLALHARRRAAAGPADPGRAARLDCCRRRAAVCLDRGRGDAGAERRHARSAGRGPEQPGLRDLHLGLDRPAQGGGGRAPRASCGLRAGRGCAASTPGETVARSSPRSPSTPRRWRSGRRCCNGGRLAILAAEAAVARRRWPTLIAARTA